MASNTSSCMKQPKRNRRETFSSCPLVFRIRLFFQGLINSLVKTKKEYEDKLRGMLPDDAAKEPDRRMDSYKAMCFGGLASLFWRDCSRIVKKQKNPVLASSAAVVFGIEQEMVIFGFVAACFPRSAPYAKMIASNGSLIAILNIAVYHLDVLVYIPNVVLGLSSGVLSGLLILLWYLSAQDLTIILALLKFIYCTCYHLIAVLRYPAVKLWNFFRRSPP